jgi:4-amino-4-deoxy-L-arabinose transferase-like glycosyltransferase
MSKLVTLVAFLVLLIGINRPLAGQHDWNSVFFGNAARNHLRLGLLKTKLGVVTNINPQPDETLGYYTHHPILMPLLLTGSLALFGPAEPDWAIRLVPVISATVMVYFLFKLVRQLWGTSTAILAACFFTFSPMLLYYSKIPVHETVVLGFLGFTFWAYFAKRYWLVVIGLVLSQLTSWAGYYLSLYLPLHTLLFTPRRWSHGLLRGGLLFLIAPLMFLVFILHNFWLTGNLESLFTAFLFRVNIPSASQIFGFSYGKFLILQARWIVIYFTRIVVLLGLGWLVGLIIRRRITLQDSYLLLLLIFGFTHNALFRQQAFIHDYTLIYALPFFAIASAVVLSNLKINKFIVLAILLLFATERLSYVKALFASGAANPGVPLGKAINRWAAPTDSSLILNTELMRFYDVFINYYADRKVIAADKLTPELMNQVDYIVIPKSHDYVTAEDKYWLYTHFPHREIPNGILFQL